MKTKKILIAILILIVALLIGTVKVEAASAEIYASKATAEVGENITITAKFTAAAWNVKVSGNGISGSSYASQTSDLSEAENVKTFKLDTSKAGQYTISITGDITDANGETKEISKNCTVTINEKPVTPKPEPEPQPEPQPEPTPEPEPEKPKELEFTSVNEKVYATGTVNIRESYSTSAKSLGQLKQGESVTRTGLSKTAADGYYWSKITYNGKTVYVISSKLTTTEPTVEEPQEEKPTEEPKEEKPVEEPIPHNENEIKDGLKSLEIDGLALTPTFSSSVYEYRVIVKEDLSQLTINAVAAKEGATITIAGNDNLQEGENLITIVVYNAKNEVEATYQITTNKSTLDLTDTDKMLQMGNKEAKRNATIFVVLLVAEIIVLIVIMILKRRNEYKKEDYEEEQEGQELTNSEENVENVEQQTLEEEKNIPRREKRKGKHF